MMMPGGDSSQDDIAITAPQAFSMDPIAGSPTGSRIDEAELESFKRRLDGEVKNRQALEREVENLGRQIAELRGESESTAEAAADSDSATSVASAAEVWFNQQALIDSGMDGLQAQQLQLFFEQLEMDRLMTRDRSRREGWSREQLGQAMQDLTLREDELRQQLGESGYDAYLYASGQPNRVAVTSVLASAQAGTAGIQPGDHILRYDNQRIYNWFDLREATGGGDISETVTLEVERDGETLQFYLARGPLGIRMDSVSVAP